ncbi:site-specific integrase [Nostocaceae cyanobacterium CENA369]|uniref:Site-specific integrase n=1 Tax=Dendronalium phyllosphericum CENA369 TaxID=1725256 RepID=A0A8J7IBS3_9NOST|nr:site-specific integrase [Dendronalium phyllosphericum]MBH8577443.1 site-specific integrase [Dendronalium phyllosphericum CENA369]
MIEQRIKEANGRLRSNNYGVSIELVGGRLYLRATLPPKLKSIKTDWHQQRISIAPANTEGVKVAEKEAKILRIRLDTKTFDWADYAQFAVNAVPTIGRWIEDFEKDYFQRRAKNFKSESTWKVEYASVFKILDSNSQLTADILKTAILSTAPDTRTRKRFCLTLGALAKFSGIDFDPSPYSGSYSPKSRKARDLPTDKLIVDWYYKIKDSKWQWVYGLLATYGLRNHEVFFLDLAELRSGNKILTVLEGKTGYRRIWPFHPEWFDQFGLQNVKIPEINRDRSNSNIGGTVSQRLRRNEGLPFKVYDLRHCWAIRTLEYEIDISLAAQQMGHSLSVHSNLYHTWIQARHHQRAFDLAISKSNRPMPPKI